MIQIQRVTAQERRMYLIALLCACIIGAGLCIRWRPGSQPANVHRTALTRNVRIAVWGDVRPDCDAAADAPDMGYHRAEITAVLKAVAESGPDLILSTGDYICAWRDEAQLARRQLHVLKSIIKSAVPENLRKVMRYAQGNHEVNHADLIRVYFDEDPYWALTAIGGVRVIAAPSDAGVLNYPGYDAWLRQELARPASVLIYIRHEPPGTHGTRHDEEMQAALSTAPPSLILYGHEHKYARSGNALTIGNGGSEGRTGPLGYVILDLKPSAALPIHVGAYDVMTGQAIDQADLPQ